MQVNLSFDTESEKVDNLKKLVEALEQLIASREGRTYQPGQKTQPASVAAPIEQKAAPDKTSGGCRVIPYEDMSGKMANIFSGRRI
ncbi:MAG TPA: hypothetical protein HA360_04135 [Nanoarchaeota archaeon]|nr:hypothetical protein [Candidatus Woesearchaeota archaeon]HIH15052.1 hypothetical protein [Nanoarchaeota archaeon]HIH59486.1 hypothetical protein [Nanoarchaeota archaeon]HII14237.1 hypothetical protein [Nanoarchaeota archaeon]HIJ04623.1 hypothetical protein [Nanoarchaeota archaeon]